MVVVLCYAGWVLIQAIFYMMFDLAWAMLWLLWFIVRIPFVIAGALMGQGRD